MSREKKTPTRLPNIRPRMPSILPNRNYILRFFCVFPLSISATVPPSNMTNTLPSRIDVHSHFLPPFYHDALVQTGNSKPDGMPAIPPWSTEAHLKMMESANVKKAVLSISSPGTHLIPGDDAARKNLTRQCNAYAADLKKQYPQKFGFWASLPLPDVDAARKGGRRGLRRIWLDDELSWKVRWRCGV
jgi:hypothetical protein